MSVWAVTPFHLLQVKSDYAHLRETLLRVTKERDLAARGKHQLQAKLENLEQVLKVRRNPEFHFKFPIHCSSIIPGAQPGDAAQTWALSAPLSPGQMFGMGAPGAGRDLKQHRDIQGPLADTL